MDPDEIVIAEAIAINWVECGIHFAHVLKIFIES